MSRIIKDISNTSIMLAKIVLFMLFFIFIQQGIKLNLCVI